MDELDPIKYRALHEIYFVFLFSSHGTLQPEYENQDHTAEKHGEEAHRQEARREAVACQADGRPADAGSGSTRKDPQTHGQVQPQALCDGRGSAVFAGQNQVFATRFVALTHSTRSHTKYTRDASCFIPAFNKYAKAQYNCCTGCHSMSDQKSVGTDVLSTLRTQWPNAATQHIDNTHVARAIIYNQDQGLVRAAMPTKGNKGRAILRHTAFKHPHAERLISETRVPAHQVYNPKSSRKHNDRAFGRFLATIQALYCATKDAEGEHDSNLIVHLNHDTPTCFMCDKTTADMHPLMNRKGNGQYLRFGPVSVPNEIVQFKMTGTYLNVDTSSAFEKEIPICSTCYAQRIAPCDYYAPQTCLAEHTAARTIMRRHWQNGGFFDCCTTVYTEEEPCWPK